MMKRFLILLLAAVMLVPVVAACTDNTNKPVETGKTGDSDSQSDTTGNNEENNTMLYTWINNGYNKVIANDDVPEVRETSHTVYMTMHEMEGCQISLRSPEDVTGLTVEASELNGITVSVSLEKTQRISGERWPDGLLPLDKIGSFDLTENLTTTLYVRFRTEGKAPAGEQTCKLTVKDSEGKDFAVFDVTVHVWNIELDDKYRTDSWIPLSWEALAKEYDFGDLRAITLSDEDTEKLREIYKMYYDLLLDYGICGGDLPYDLLDERANAYLDDPRVTVFTLGHSEVDEEQLTAYYNKIKDNPTWLAKAVYYSLDEPTTNEMLDELARRSALVNQIAPGVKTISAFYDNFNYGANTDATTFMMNNLDIIVPKLCLFDRVGGMANYKKRMEAYKASGKQVYTYVCWEPWKPYLNVFVNEKGIDHRILFWQIFDCEADGFLYWSANQWYDLDVNPWFSMQTIPWMTRDIYGDGSLMYPGNKFGFDDPCSSLRLEAIRDGLEDTKLLKMAKEYFGSEYVDKKVDKITRSPALSTSDSSLFDEIRKDIGDALEEKLSQNP